MGKVEIVDCRAKYTFVYMRKDAFICFDYDSGSFDSNQSRLRAGQAIFAETPNF